MATRWIAALAAVVLIVAGCSSGGTSTDATEGSGGELQATRWVLSSYASEGTLTVVPDGQYADARFTANRVKGFAGCNDYDAVYRAGGRMLLVSMPILTLAFCSEDANAFEGTYMSLLQASRFYSVRAGTLTIRGPEREILLMFDAAPRNPLLGSWVVESYQDSTGAVVTPLPDTELTAVFRLSKVAGFAGCNTYQGPYTSNESIAAIGPLATTRMACAEDVMAQETAFLAALQGVGRIGPRADSVMLQDRSGSLLVGLVRPSAPEPSPSPSIAAPSASPSAAPSTSPSASPSATPTAAPTATPTPVASATPAPTVPLPSSIPPEATCTITQPATQSSIATVVYPADWFTLAAPPELACRYFDPAEIIVPTDPATLSTAVMIRADPTSTYTAEFAAATDPANWTMTTNEPVTVSGLPATRLEGTSAAATSGYPVGTTRYGYLIDAGGRPVWIETSGTATDATFTTNVSVVDLIAAESTILSPS